MSEKLSLLTQDKNAKIIEKKEFLDMNDALVNDSSVQIGELDNEVAIIKKKAARLKAGNVQQLIAANDGLAAEVQQLSQFDEFVDTDVAFLIKSEEENYNQQIETTKKRAQKIEQDIEIQKQIIQQKEELKQQETLRLQEKTKKTSMIEEKTKELQQ